MFPPSGLRKNAAIDSASSGIQQNLHQFNVAVDSIATTPFGPDMINDLAQMKLAELGVSANIKVLVASDRVLSHIVDLTA